MSLVLTAAYVLQIALFGAAGTAFIRAHLARRRLAAVEAARPARERYAMFSAARRDRAPAPREAAEALRLVGQRLLHGLLFLAAALAASALTFLLGPSP